MLSNSKYSLFFFVVLIIGSVCCEGEAESSPGNTTIVRAKRYDGYYGGYGYDGWGGDWYGGRFFGILLGVFLLMLCCCVPLICLAGIWFMGWFGIKGRREARLKQQGVAYGTGPPPAQIVQLHSEPQPVIRTVYPRTRSLSPNRTTFATAAPTEQVVYTAEDRYYTSSTSPPRHHNSRI